VLPHPAAVRALSEVAAQVVGVHLAAVRQVLGHRHRGLLGRRERLVLGHEVDDAVDALVLEAVADIDERDGDEELGAIGGEREADDPAERRAHERGAFDPELVEQRRHGARQRAAIHRLDRVRVAVAGKVRREDVVRGRERGAQLLPHVRGLAAAVEAHDGRRRDAAPLEVVNLAFVDDREAAPSAGGDVVARGEELELCVGSAHAPLDRPRSQAALSW
jgi:hypothetical protein